MLKNYVIVAFRNIMRQKGFSVINVIGLAIGLTVCILILMWVQDELSFDTFNEKADQIYRVGSQYGTNPDNKGPFSSPPMADALLRDFPEILHAARLSLWPKNRLVSYNGNNEKKYIEKGIISADTSIFDVFTLPFIHGDPKTALINPWTIVITKDIAKKYFGDENPMGKSLQMDNRENNFTITGVVENCPHNSHFQFDMIISTSTSKTSLSTSWMSHCYFTYVVLQKGCDPSQLESKFPDFIKRHYGPKFQEETGMTLEDYYKKEKKYYGYWLQPLKDIHLHSNSFDKLTIKGNITYIYVFSLVAVLILLIACINFMNLSTARAANRSKEIGLRKVMGSGRKQLIRQFLTESLLLSFFALIIAVVFIEMLLPVFNHIAGRELGSHFINIENITFLILVTIVVGILAGSYPAFFLSAFQPIDALKKKFFVGTRGKKLRNGLVLFQFSVSIIILICTMVVYHQLKYVQQTSLGFDKTNVIVVHRAKALGQQRQAFKQELLRHPNIITVSDTDSLPGRHFEPNGYHLEGDPPYKENILHTMYSDDHFAELLNLKITAGRFFSPRDTDDSMVVINETAVKKLGLTNPVGKRFHKEFDGGKPGEFVTIIGVLKDFHFLSLHSQIHPMLIRHLTDANGMYTSVKFHPGNITGTLKLIKETWEVFSGDQPFEYSFLDNDLDTLYQSEQKTGEIFGLFSILAVFIACLGLLGLASFAAVHRTREIGIRKVLGASSPEIVILLSKEFSKWVLIANIIAWPIAYFAMDKWLQNFAFRVSIGIGPIFLSGIFTLLMALLTISYQSIKAAVVNPIDTLRCE
jgi:putative ABC transport system permease protein